MSIQFHPKGGHTAIIREEVSEEVPKVEKGTECGMMFDPAFDFEIGDIIESFRVY